MQQLFGAASAASLLRSAYMVTVIASHRGGGRRIPGVKYGEKALRVTPQLLWRAGVEVACTGAHHLALHTHELVKHS